MALPPRVVNDYRRKAFGSDPDRRVAFVCECTEEDCRSAVVLTIRDYDDIRTSGGAVVVDSSHRPPDENTASR